MFWMVVFDVDGRRLLPEAPTCGFTRVDPSIRHADDEM
jgi:hypothetical protein